MLHLRSLQYSLFSPFNQPREPELAKPVTHTWLTNKHTRPVVPDILGFFKYIPQQLIEMAHEITLIYSKRFVLMNEKKLGNLAVCITLKYF